MPAKKKVQSAAPASKKYSKRAPTGLAAIQKLVSSTGLDMDSSKYNPLPFNKPALNHNATRFKGMYDKLKNEEQQLVDMILDPEACETTIRWPNTYGLSSTYKSVNIINANFDNVGESIVLAYPKMSNSIFATAAQSYPFTVAKEASVVATNNMCTQQIEIGPSTNQQVDLTAPFYFGDNHVSIPFPHYTGNSTHFLYPLQNVTVPINNAASPYLNCSFTDLPVDPATGPINVAVRIYDNNLALINTYNATVSAGQAAEVQIADPASATLNSLYISVRIQYNGNHSYEGMANFTIFQSKDAGAPATFSWQLPHRYTHCTVYELNASKQIATSAEKYIVLAQSLLVSWRGSTLNNSGLCASARIPSGTGCIGSKTDTSVASGAGGSAYYNWISALQSNKADNALREGTYSFYLGDDESDYFYRSTEDQDIDTPYLVAAFSTAVATAANTVRIKIVTHLQFKSNSNVYSQAPSPYMRHRDMLPHILSLVNSSYTNDGHKEGLGQYLKGLGKKIGKVLLSPDTWLNVAEILMLLGL